MHYHFTKLQQYESSLEYNMHNLVDLNIGDEAKLESAVLRGA